MSLNSSGKLNEIARLDFLRREDRGALFKLADEFLRGNGVIFAGAGLSRNALYLDGGPSRIPDWNALAKLFKEQLGSTQNESDPLKLAGYFEARFGRPALVKRVADAISDGNHRPGPVHRIIADLDIKEIVTTNFDTLIERAFQENSRGYAVIASDSAFTMWTSKVCIIKMNGCLSEAAERIVVTEKDFLDYGQRRPVLQSSILRSLADSQILFVGFGLKDPAFLMINQKANEALGEDRPLSYCLSFDVSEELFLYWYKQKIRLIDLGPLNSSRFAPEARLHRALQTLLPTKNPNEEHREVRRLMWGRFDSVPDSESCCYPDWIDDLLGEEEHIRSFTRGIRARPLTLVTLFAPIGRLLELVDTWRSLPSSIHSSCHLVPEEERVSLVTFFDLALQDTFYKGALDSLWRRLQDTSNGRHEVGYRYRNLYSHLARLQKTDLLRWATFHLQEKPLERTLTELFLEKAARGTYHARIAVVDALRDLDYGWIFATKVPPRLHEAWGLAHRDMADGRPGDVPWEMLTVLTLTIDGQIIEQQRALLEQAWACDVLDLMLLSKYLRCRFEGALPHLFRRDGRLRGASSPIPQLDSLSYEPPWERHLFYLARFGKWMARRFATEVNTDSRQQDLLEKLRLSILRWAPLVRHYSRLRLALLEAAASLVTQDAQTSADTLMDWAETDLLISIGLE